MVRPNFLEGYSDAPESKAVKTPDFLQGYSDASKKETSFSQRVGEDISKRVGQEKEAIKGAVYGTQSLPSTALQAIGAGAGLISDVGGEVAQSVTPDAIKKPIISVAKKIGKYVADTDIGKAGIAKADQAQQLWESFSKKHPEAAKDLGALGNIATALPVSKMAGGATKTIAEPAAPYLKFGGEKLTKAGEKQAVEKETKSLINLVSPKETKKIAEENVGKTVEKGLLRRQEVVPDKFTQDIANTIKDVPGISPNRSYQYNYNKIAAENLAEAKKLNSVLKASNVPISLDRVRKATADIQKHLSEQTFMVGDAKKVSDKMIEKAGNLLKQNGYTASGMLKTRQEFDTWAKGQLSGDPFSDTNRARGASLKAIRDSMNNIIAEAVPDANVKASLTKQFHLYNALDNIKTKAASEGKNVVTRIITKLEDNLPTRNPYIKHGLAATGLGVAALHPATLAAAVPYAAYKGATSPTTKRVIGKGLTKMGDILSTPAQ